ncbi:hypothetical protein C4N9_20930 [Pararhodobacter marinus]|uniref:DUF3168 domain-containing protein n=1 Tax=Pararhodobacter marinus TaxID=2184063 RepID=A0A2U2C4B2_9RHOB|nr:phage tail terminator-like protein [Pararhodobacter marinus]PWE26726.1 hypothetical protein C4N9_20930 [Pararhodobacter marinus]
MTPNEAFTIIAARLRAMPDCPPVVWPNTNFEPVLPRLIFQQPVRGANDPTLGGGYKVRTGRAVVIVATALVDDFGDAADTLATQIEALFPTGPLPTQPAGVLTIVQSQVLGGYQTDTDWRVPVQIDWRA